MRPIKFRGRVPDTDKLDGGRIVYGSLVDYGEDAGLYRYWIHPIGGGGRNYFPVDENSIAQLVGYDANGNEVYEGDTVTVDGEKLDGTARISPEIIFGNGFGKIVNEATQKIITLKE